MRVIGCVVLLAVGIASIIDHVRASGTVQFSPEAVAHLEAYEAWAATKAENDWLMK